MRDSPDGNQIYGKLFIGKILAWNAMSGQIQPKSPREMPEEKFEKSLNGKLRVFGQ